MKTDYQGNNENFWDHEWAVSSASYGDYQLSKLI